MKTVIWILAALLGGPQQDEAYQVAELRAKAQLAKLEKSPEDPDACEGVGRFLCLVKGDWVAGLPYLAKAKDKALRQMAEYELGTAELPADPKSPLTGAVIDFGDAAAPDLVKGDMLWDLSKRFKDHELRGILNRAIWRYREALSKVSDDRKRKLMDRISKVMSRYRALYTHPGKTYEGAPKGWGVVIGKGGKVEGIATDESKSHTGRASLKVTPAKDGLLVTERHPIQPGEYTLSFWYLAEGTVAADPFHVLLYDGKDGCAHVQPSMPPDKGEIPVWVHVETKVKVGPEVLIFRLYIDNVSMRDGTLWFDDVSFKSQKGEELAPNGGFEER